MTAHGPLGAALELACRALALLGGAVLGVLTAGAGLSIIGRACCARPIPGDYELMQVGVAVAVSLFLPWCQMRRGNIAVDFFTAQWRPSRQIRLDALGSLLLATMMALLAWRTAHGAAGLQQAGETTMILGLPLWLGYAAMVPGLALTALAGLYIAADDWRRSTRWQD